MTIHLGRRASQEGWVSFESDAHLRRTKERLHQRCLPCLTSLLGQLKEDAGAIELGMAWDCWKVVAVLVDRDEGLELLAKFEATYPEEYVFGKMGTGKGRKTYAVMFHTEDAARRDQLFTMLRAVVGRHLAGREVFYSRGCGDPYERLLGPWQSWRPRSPIKHPERLGQVKADLRESLYGRS